jgi:hypothetical protein
VIEAERRVTALPTTLEGLAIYELESRSAILNALPVGVRSRLWREHFAAVRAHIGPTALTPTQSTLLQWVDENLERIFAERGWSDSLAVRHADLQRAFPLQLGRTLFTEPGSVSLGELGQRVAGERSLLAGFDVSYAFSDPKSQAAAAEHHKCTCSRSSTWCGGPPNECLADGCETTWGCGTLFMYTCDGRCYNLS